MFTHMPFHKDGLILCCAYDNLSVIKVREKEHKYAAWKVHYYNDGEPRKINTGFSDDIIECSPSFYKKNDEFILSLITTKFGDFVKLYELSGPSFEELTKSELVFNGPILFGFSNESYIVRGYNEPGCFMLFNRKEMAEYEYKTNFSVILRMTYYNNNLIITGKKNHILRSVLYNFNSVKEILVDNKPIYKCSINGDMVYHARKLSGHEEREISFDKYELVDTDITVNQK